MIRFLSILTCVALIFAFDGCTYGTQVSSLKSYNGPRLGGSEKCVVHRTSIESRFVEFFKENEENLLGDSHVSSAGSYDIIEAAYDCMTIGAKSVLVLERGVVSSTISSSVGSNSNQSLYTVTSYGFRDVSGYIVVFFNKEIKEPGILVTIEDYKSWLRKNRMAYCDGCGD